MFQSASNHMNNNYNYNNKNNSNSKKDPIGMKYETRQHIEPPGDDGWLHRRQQHCSDERCTVTDPISTLVDYDMMDDNNINDNGNSNSDNSYNIKDPPGFIPTKSNYTTNKNIPVVQSNMDEFTIPNHYGWSNDDNIDDTDNITTITNSSDIEFDHNDDDENDLPIISLEDDYNIIEHHDVPKEGGVAYKKSPYPASISTRTSTTSAITESYNYSITEADTEYSIDYNNYDNEEILSTLNDTDVLFGRGSRISQHVGNQAWLRYRNILYPLYVFAENNEMEQILIQKLIHWVYSNNGRFMQTKVARTRITSGSMIHSSVDSRSSGTTSRLLGASNGFTTQVYYDEVTDYNRIYKKASQALRDGVL